MLAWFNVYSWSDAELLATMKLMRPLTTLSGHAGIGCMRVHPRYAACAMIGVMPRESFD